MVTFQQLPVKVEEFSIILRMSQYGFFSMLITSAGGNKNHWAGNRFPILCSCPPSIIDSVSPPQLGLLSYRRSLIMYIIHGHWTYLSEVTWEMISTCVIVCPVWCTFVNIQEDVLSLAVSFTVVGGKSCAERGLGNLVFLLKICWCSWRSYILHFYPL